jgi:hypothetical protein
MLYTLLTAAQQRQHLLHATAAAIVVLLQCYSSTAYSSSSLPDSIEVNAQVLHYVRVVHST